MPKLKFRPFGGSLLCCWFAFVCPSLAHDDVSEPNHRHWKYTCLTSDATVNSFVEGYDDWQVLIGLYLVTDWDLESVHWSDTPNFHDSHFLTDISVDWGDGSPLFTGQFSIVTGTRYAAHTYIPSDPAISENYSIRVTVDEDLCASVASVRDIVVVLPRQTHGLSSVAIGNPDQLGQEFATALVNASSGVTVDSSLTTSLFLESDVGDYLVSLPVALDPTSGGFDFDVEELLNIPGIVDEDLTIDLMGPLTVLDGVESFIFSLDSWTASNSVFVDSIRGLFIVSIGIMVILAFLSWFRFLVS